MFDISVIIPTRNRAALLGPCLASLCEQRLDPARFEICVVDNGSTDMTPKVVELINAHYPKHRVFIVDEPQLGVTHARNAGVRHTTAPLVAQTDDDATVPPDWLEHFLAAFAEHDKSVCKVGGEIIPIWGGPRPAWLTDGMLPLLSASSGFGDRPRFVDEGLLEGNSCYRRDALAAGGNFPTMLGHKGNNLLSADNAIDLVLHMSGWKLYYDPSITINHNIHANRLTPTWMRRRYFWQGVSNYAVLAYLKTKGIEPQAGVSVEMPFERDNWTFINDGNEPPTEEKLDRLRSLGFVLASSGFIPVG